MPREADLPCFTILYLTGGTCILPACFSHASAQSNLTASLSPNRSNCWFTFFYPSIPPCPFPMLPLNFSVAQNSTSFHPSSDRGITTLELSLISCTQSCSRMSSILLVCLSIFLAELLIEKQHKKRSRKAQPCPQFVCARSC